MRRRRSPQGMRLAALYLLSTLAGGVVITGLTLFANPEYIDYAPILLVVVALPWTGILYAVDSLPVGVAVVIIGILLNAYFLYHLGKFVERRRTLRQPMRGTAA